MDDTLDIHNIQPIGTQKLSLQQTYRQGHIHWGLTNLKDKFIKIIRIIIYHSLSIYTGRWLPEGL